MSDKQRREIRAYDEANRVARELPELDVFQLMQLHCGVLIDCSTTDEEG